MLAAVAGARYSTTPVTTRTADSTDRATRSPRGTGYRRGGSTPGVRSCTTRNGGISSRRPTQMGTQKHAAPPGPEPRPGNSPPQGKTSTRNNPGDRVSRDKDSTGENGGAGTT